jgi:hypothetical protein
MISKEKRRAYYAANKERMRAVAKVYRDNNIEKRRAWHKKYRDANPGWHKKGSLKFHYGMSLEDYDSMLQSQDNKCASCGTELIQGKNANIDHNNITGQIRGVLCVNCNLALGHLKEDWNRIVKLSTYIGQYK